MNNFLLVGIIVFLLYDHYIPKREKMILFGCIIISIILNLKGGLAYFYMNPENPHRYFIKIVDSWIGYCLRPVLLWGLWEMMHGPKSKKIRILFAVLAIANALIFSTCFFSDLTFGIRPVDFQWYRGPLGLTAHVVMVIMMFLFIPTLIRMFLDNRRADFTAGLLTLISILVVVYIDTYHDQHLLDDIITFEAILYFMFVHIGLEEEYTKTMLKAQKAEMLLMQIKPHFINNTLGTIQALCEIDPQLASRTTGAFARYLRANLTVMDKPLPIPIKEELDHTRTYLEIETLRFPWIHVEYDIQDTDFSVPPLSVQPLAENAVQHGLRQKKKKSGKLLIRTRRVEKGHVVEIIDDGVGFDVKNPVIKEGHGVGTHNVRYRIEEVSHGTLTIESVVGEGTTSTIFIPEKR